MASQTTPGIAKRLAAADPKFHERTKRDECTPRDEGTAQDRLAARDALSEPERYELSEPPRYNFELGRRGFLGVAGAGLLISVAQPAARAQSRAGNEGVVAARVRIAKDGGITVMTGKVEVGQGSRAELTQAAAEELKVQPSAITLLMADTALTPDDGATAGSRTTPSSVPAVRRGTAAAREILLELAAKQWGVESSSLKAENGAIVDATAHRKVTYAELASTADLDRGIPEDRSARRHRNAGRRLDGDRRFDAAPQRPRHRHRRAPLPLRHHAVEHALRQSAAAAILRRDA